MLGLFAVQGLTHVLLLDLPDDRIGYIHCAGRVGRLGGHGVRVRRPGDVQDDNEGYVP
jgi:superfamily II DNA/RNA helicase